MSYEVERRRAYTRLRQRESVLRPREVAVLLGCNADFLTRLADSGKIGHFRTPGGHRRYYSSDVRKYLVGIQVVQRGHDDLARAIERTAGDAK